MRVLLITVGFFAAWAASSSALAEPTTQAVIESALARLVERAIPLTYEKRKDWGRRRRVTVGVKVDGLRISKRSKHVRHGVWKYYVLTAGNGQPMSVGLSSLRVDGSGIRFTATVEGTIDAWARAKVYQYGVHLIALELEADCRFRARVDCVVTPAVPGPSSAPRLGLVPRVEAAELVVDELNIRRISNADGPVVRQLGDGVRRLLADELNGPRLVEKLNRALQKKQSRFEWTLPELFEIGSAFDQRPSEADPTPPTSSQPS
ncbi:MAG: hypothetical protein AAGA92_04375 [Planctomycetota bacterium]